MGDTLYAVPLSDALFPFFADETRLLICYDWKSLRRMLGTWGIDFARCAHDVMLAAYVVDSADSYGLPRLVNRYLTEEYDESIGEAQYAAALYPVLDTRLCESDEVGLMYDIELPTARVLADMETRGFKIDREGLRRFGEGLAQCEAEYTERIYTLAGTTFNLNSPKQLGEILFDRLGPAGREKRPKPVTPPMPKCWSVCAPFIPLWKIFSTTVRSPSCAPPMLMGFCVSPTSRAGCILPSTRPVPRPDVCPRSSQTCKIFLSVRRLAAKCAAFSSLKTTTMFCLMQTIRRLSYAFLADILRRRDDDQRFRLGRRYSHLHCLYGFRR